MLEVIAYVVPSALVILLGAYVYVEAQRRKVIEEKKKAIILRVASIKNNFKVAMNRLVEQQILTIKQHESIYRIANNFFIFQPVTTKSIDFCEYSLNNIISVMPNGGPDSLHFEFIQEKISLFVCVLPVAANAYNGHFYRKALPKLISQLVEAKEEIYKIESDLSPVKSPIMVASQAA
ncbi:hypothetical protein [Psychromonas hadalis]|uniref:hypothetical protein n=1 Tax=Psychromonas hadalis TaxID=211669 RepID=UPI0003B71997|nr:hypothetical protein [Psychromonas hadalis]